MSNLDEVSSNGVQGERFNLALRLQGVLEEYRGWTYTVPESSDDHVDAPVRDVDNQISVLLAQIVFLAEQKTAGGKARLLEKIEATRAKTRDADAELAEKGNFAPGEATVSVTRARLASEAALREENKRVFDHGFANEATVVEVTSEPQTQKDQQ